MDQLDDQTGVFEPHKFFCTPEKCEVVILNIGTLARSYVKHSGQVICWSADTKFPADNVPSDTKQAARCLDCTQSIKQGGMYKGTPCKFYTVVQLYLPDTDTVCSLRLGAASLFSRHPSYLSLFKYIDYLAANDEEAEDILTNIYFGDESGLPKIYFKPVRSLTKVELLRIEQLNLAALDTHNPFQLTIEENFMSESKITHLINNVIAHYPRLDQPYHFDKTAGANGKSVPCPASTANARYETDFLLTEPQAIALYNVMQKAFTESPHRDKSWPDKLAQPFKQHEDYYVGKCNFKAMYKSEVTKPPAVFDATNTRLPEDFLLTTGSIINVFVELVPFNMTTSGVSLRLRGVQVIKYVPYVPSSPFEAQDGYTGAEESTVESEPETMFAAVAAVAEVAEVEDDIPDTVPEPVKRTTKKVKPPKVETDLASVIDKWASDS